MPLAFTHMFFHRRKSWHLLWVTPPATLPHGGGGMVDKANGAQNREKQPQGSNVLEGQMHKTREQLLHSGQCECMEAFVCYLPGPQLGPPRWVVTDRKLSSEEVT